jgi:hypothetical protein
MLNMHYVKEYQSSPVAHAPPGPPSAAAAEGALGGAAVPAAPGAAPGAAAGAGINGAQERVILQQPPERASTERRSV